MPITLTETDTAGPGLQTLCGLFTSQLETNALSLEASQGGTAGSTITTFTHAAQADTRISFQFTSPTNVPNSTSWESGNWVVRLEVTTANMNVDWDAVEICRVDSGGVNVATVVATSGLAINLGTTGVKSTTQSGTAQSGANATHRMGISIDIKNGTSMTQSWAGKPSQNIDTPVNQGGAVADVGWQNLVGVGR